MTLRRFIGLCAILVSVLIVACSGPEEKKMKFFNNGKGFYEKGDYVSPTKANRNGLRYECDTGGTSHTSEPSWGTVAGATTSEGGGDVKWVCVDELPNSLKDGEIDLEDDFIELVAGRIAMNYGMGKLDKANIGGLNVGAQYFDAGKMMYDRAIKNLKAVSVLNMKQFYPTA